MNDYKYSTVDTLGTCTCMTKTPELEYHDVHCVYRMAEKIIDLQSQIAGQWISVDTDLPSDSLPNDIGRRRFLCQVEYRGTMIVAEEVDVVMYSKDSGFLVKNKGSLIAKVTDWMPLPPKGEN